jgi:hypothetical protein
MPATRRSARTAAKEAAAPPAAVVKKTTTAAAKKTQQSSSPSTSKSTTAVAAGGLKVGGKIPADLTVIDQTGVEHTLGSLVDKNGMVIFFYPKANTPGIE